MRTRLGNCRLCQQEELLMFSHIFPEPFYKPVYDEEHRFISVSSHPHHKTKPIEKGLREYLLCEDCEKLIKNYEDYSIPLLRSANKYKMPDGKAIEIPNIDYVRFKLFALSLIWRSHVSSLHIFSAVNLRSHAETIRRMLLDKNPGNPQQYCIALIKIEGTKSAQTIIHSPAKTRFRGHNAYIFLAYGYEWLFIVSNHSDTLPKDYPFVGMKPQLVILLKYQTEREFIGEMRRRMSEQLIEKSKRAT